MTEFIEQKTKNMKNTSVYILTLEFVICNFPDRFSLKCTEFCKHMVNT